MISPRQEFQFQEEYNRFQRLVNTAEYLTRAEYEFIKAYDADEAANFFYIGDYSAHGDYLNLNLYSEHDHEKREFELEY